MKNRWLLLLVLLLTSATSPLPAREPPPDAGPSDSRTSTPAPVAKEPPPGWQLPAPQKREPRVKLPTVEAGKAMLDYVERSRQTDKDYRLRVDLSRQNLAFDVPKITLTRNSIHDVRRHDTMTVTAQTAKVMSGSDVVAEASRGRLLCAIEVKDPWILTAVLVDGRRTIGWIHNSEVRLHSAESRLYKAPAEITRAEFAAAGLLVQKAKWFDDGLYAAVELAAQNGAGRFSGKRHLLETLAADLARPPAGELGQAVEIVLAGSKLGRVPVDLGPAAAGRVDGRVQTFLGDPLRSKPLAFYTWSDELSSIFRQDRMLQTSLVDRRSPRGDSSLERLLKALHDNSDCRETYETYLRLVYRLTNPSSRPDLTGLLAALDGNEPAAFEDDVAFFPPSRSPETELMKRLYGNRPIPAGFNLADELVRRIRDGSLDLRPKEDSGWYDRQLWALQPLAVPEQTPEARHVSLSDRYREKLVELFKGAYALTRETHIKQLEVPEVGAAPSGHRPPPKPKFRIWPELSGEPLPTFCLRRAEAYRFVREVLEGIFGAEGLKTMHRQTPDGPVDKCLDEELTEIESLFYGAYVTLSRQLGAMPDPPVKLGTGDAEADARAFMHWSANHSFDPDLGRDVRMMVPLFYDVVRKKTKVWAMLGWRWYRLKISFSRKPSVTIFDADGNQLERDQYELSYGWRTKEAVTPVTAEFYVDRLLNRDEFRQLLDTYKTESAILQHVASGE